MITSMIALSSALALHAPLRPCSGYIALSRPRLVSCTTPPPQVSVPLLDNTEGSNFATTSSVLRVQPRPWRWLCVALLMLAVASRHLPLLCQRALAAYHGYERAAISLPLLTKSATSGVAYLLGDAIAQVASRTPLDRGRVVRAMIAGAVSHGPQLHYWTLLLDRLPINLPTKIALDQTIFSLYLNGVFCVMTEAMQRRPLGLALRKARAAAWPCLSAGWRFWPAVHALTFTVIPFHLRVLWVDMLEVAWVSILSTNVARSSSGGSGTAQDQSRTDSSCVDQGAAEPSFESPLTRRWSLWERRGIATYGTVTD